MKKKTFLLRSFSFLQAFDKIIPQNFVNGKQIKLVLFIFPKLNRELVQLYFFSLEVLKLDTI